MKIAVIGSRETKSHVMAFMCGTIRRLSIEHPDIVWVSGGCDTGPDNLITYLAHKYGIKHEIYLPDEARKRVMSRRYPSLNFIVAADYETDDRYRSKVQVLHPAPEYLKDFHYKLHGRNLNIINGESLDAKVDAVFFAANTNRDGTVKGGTGMGVAYSRELGIPDFNANFMDEVRQFFEFLK